MKKLFKFLFILIFIAALAGCGFFGYHYFKDSFGPKGLTLADAKELVYTTYYDLGEIDAEAFSTALNKAPIIKPTNIMREPVGVDIPCDYEGTETYSIYTDNIIYIVGGNNYLNEGSPYGFGLINRENGFSSAIAELLSHNAEENVYYLISNDGVSFKASYDIDGNKLTCKIYGVNENVECVYEFVMLNKTKNGITDYSLTLRCCGNWLGQYPLCGVLKLDVASENGVKVANRFANVLGGNSWSKSYDCDIVNNKILYSNNTVAMNAKIKANVEAHCQADPETYYANVDAIDLPTV